MANPNENNNSDDDDDDEEPPQIVSAEKMRPGGIGRTVFYILMGSLILVGLAWIVLEIWAYKTDTVP